MVRVNKCIKNEYSAKMNIHIPNDPNKSPSGILWEIKSYSVKIYKRPRISYATLVKGKKDRGVSSIGFQGIL